VRLAQAQAVEEAQIVQRAGRGRLFTHKSRLVAAVFVNAHSGRAEFSNKTTWSPQWVLTETRGVAGYQSKNTPTCSDDVTARATNQVFRKVGQHTPTLL
jgi:hypothetical protein